MELNFVEPPKLTRGRKAGTAGLMREFLTELANHPNKWAEFPEKVGSSTYAQRWKKVFPNYEYRLVNAKNPENQKQWTLFVKFIGED